MKISAALIAIIGIILCSCASDDAYLSENIEHEYATGTYLKERNLNYRVLSPESTDETGPYPLVLFLHGAGERGNDNKAQLTVGASYFAEHFTKFPAYIIFPQCPEGLYWGYAARPSSFIPSEMPENITPTWIAEDIKALIDCYIADGLVDADRVYIVGLSMGAIGALDLAAHYPDTFAGVVSMCGTIKPSRLDALHDVHFLLFHGKKDETIPVQTSRIIYDYLDDIGADVTYVEYGRCGHNCWKEALKSDDIIKWMMNITK